MCRRWVASHAASRQPAGARQQALGQGAGGGHVVASVRCGEHRQSQEDVVGGVTVSGQQPFPQVIEVVDDCEPVVRGHSGGPPLLRLFEELAALVEPELVTHVHRGSSPSWLSTAERSRSGVLDPYPPQPISRDTGAVTRDWAGHQRAHLRKSKSPGPGELTGASSGLSSRVRGAVFSNTGGLTTSPSGRSESVISCSTVGP